MLPVEVTRCLEALRPALLVVLTTHPEVREVVQEEPEGSLAVLGVLEGIEDVRVPDLVDLLGGDDGLIGVHRDQLEEPTVLHDRPLRFGDAHAFDVRFRVNQLEGDRTEVQLVDATEPFLGIDCQCVGH